MSRAPLHPATQDDIKTAIAKHLELLPLAEVCSIVERQAEIETSFLLHFVNEPIPGGMDRLRPEQVQHSLRLIAALRVTVDVARKVAEMSPVARSLMGFKP